MDSLNSVIQVKVMDVPAPETPSCGAYTSINWKVLTGYMANQTVFVWPFETFDAPFNPAAANVLGS